MRSGEGSGAMWMLLLLNLAGDVAFQLGDGEFVVFDDPFDHVADADQANHLLVFHDRKMADMFGGHERHAFFGCVCGADEQDLARSWCLVHEGSVPVPQRGRIKVGRRDSTSTA